MNFRTGRLGLALAAVPLLLTAGAFTGTSQAADTADSNTKPTARPTGLPADLTAGEAELMRKQKLLTDVASRLLGGVPVASQYTIAGFGGMTLDPATTSIKLYWKGTVPARVNTVRRSLPAGVTVTVLAAKYSRAELRTAQQKLLSSSGQDAKTVAASGATISSVAPVGDGSGLRVTYADRNIGGTYVSDTPDGPVPTPKISGAPTNGGTVPSPTEVPRATKTQLVGSSVSAATGVTTTTTYSPLATPTSGRQNDTSAWYGGAALVSTTGKYCSTGFAVTRNSDSRFAVLSSDHCSDYADTGSVRDPRGEYIGSVTAHSPALDAAVITQRSDRAAGPRVWFGSPQELIDSRSVQDVGTNVVGGLVCTSGASTGIHCSSEITSVGGTLRTSDGVLHTSVVTAQRTTGTAAVGTGDSGGPVVAFHGNDLSAMGIITSASDGVPCTWTPAISANCYETVHYADLQQVLTDLDVSLVTSSS